MKIRDFFPLIFSSSRYKNILDSFINNWTKKNSQRSNRLYTTTTYIYVYMPCHAIRKIAQISLHSIVSLCDFFFVRSAMTHHYIKTFMMTAEFRWVLQHIIFFRDWWELNGRLNFSSHVPPLLHHHIHFSSPSAFRLDLCIDIDPLTNRRCQWSKCLFWVLCLYSSVNVI